MDLPEFGTPTTPTDSTRSSTPSAAQHGCCYHCGCWALACVHGRCSVNEFWVLFLEMGISAAPQAKMQTDSC